jgi:hypothetical protein
MIGLPQVPAGAEVLSEERSNQLLGLRMFLDRHQGEGWEWEDWEALLELWERESNWRAGAANSRSSARGIPQAMLSLNPEIDNDGWRSDAGAQIGWGLDYIKGRYGSPSKALKFHDEKGWY